MKRDIILVGVIAAVAAVTVLASWLLLLGGIPQTTLTASTAQGEIENEVQQEITPGSQDKLPAQNPGSGGVDSGDISTDISDNYTVSNETFFEDDKWVVATISSNEGLTEDATIVLQKQGDSYETVLGPGTAFPRSEAETFPTSVQDHLEELGMLYGSE